MCDSIFLRIHWFRILTSRSVADIGKFRLFQAYACLSDVAKRRAFELEKSRNFCWECKRIPYVRTVPSPTTRPNTGPEPRRKIHGLDEVKVRFREEARVIENCLRASAVLRRELVNDPSCDGRFAGKLDRLRACKESPIFDPAHYIFDGYPHLRTRVKNTSSGEFRCFHGMGSSGYGQRIGTKKSDSPIFMGMTGSGLARSRSSCVRSWPKEIANSHSIWGMRVGSFLYLFFPC